MLWSCSNSNCIFGIFSTNSILSKNSIGTFMEKTNNLLRNTPKIAMFIFLQLYMYGNSRIMNRVANNSLYLSW